MTEAVPLGGDSRWLLSLSGDLDLTVGLGIAARPGHPLVGVTDGVGLPTTTLGSISIQLRKQADPDEAMLLFGSPTGTNLRGHALYASLGLELGNGQDAELSLECAAEQALLTISPVGADSFLASFLPSDGLETQINLRLNWSSRRGLRLCGGAGLEATIPIHADILNVLRIDSVCLSVAAGAAGDLSVVISMTVTVKLGPITATVERFGLRTRLRFPSGGGNLGPADLRTAFEPPSGAALTIESGLIVGGGYLFFDPNKEQYAGAVQLEVAGKLSLSAFGLLTTHMPNGSKGFSLLVLIATEFSPPVQLGYGFTLSGVGGLFGANRTVAVDVLRSGLRAGTLGSVLFPQDPIRNAPQIVSDLQAIFPPAEGRYLLGPVAKLGWGTPTVLTIELGLIIELPEPVRLFLLGRLRVQLPEERNPVVRLQLDALGVIDFDTEDVSLDAVLFDSRVAQFAVTGAMALRGELR